MENDIIVQNIVEVIRHVAERTGLSQEEVAEETIQYLTEEIEKQIKHKNPLT